MVGTVGSSQLVLYVQRLCADCQPGISIEIRTLPLRTAVHVQCTSGSHIHFLVSFIIPALVCSETRLCARNSDAALSVGGKYYPERF